MKCLILAAGYATRMYPLTENFPKPLLEIGRKAILDWLVDDVYINCGISDIVVISNHKFFNHFSQWAEEKVGISDNGSLKITVLDDGSTDNEHRLGAVKDIEFAVDSLGINEDVLVLAGDNLLDFALSGFVSYAKKVKTTCIMRHYQKSVEKLRKTGVVEIDDDSLVLSMEEKPAEPKSNWAVPPFYYYASSDLELLGEGISSGCGTDAPGSFISWLIQKRPVHAYEMPGNRFDVGSIEGYEKIRVTYQGINRK
ncbi:MAG: nucleotidyltransferase family protein [Sphaerochaetaceae bacterium]|nr:nucleotidyltransferase family protein [Sphaerochaetaceae bacterium]